MHVEGERPALVGLPGRRPPGGCAVADQLGRRGGMERDHDCGCGWGDPAPAKAERDDDGGSDDGSGGGRYSSEAASITSPHGQPGDLWPGLRPGWRRELWSRLDPGLVPGRRRELWSRLDPGLVPGRRRELWSRLDPGLVAGRRRELWSRLDPGLVPGRRRELWSRLDLGGGLIVGGRAAISLGGWVPGCGEHAGDGASFEPGGWLGRWRQVLEHLAEVAELGHGRLAVRAVREMTLKILGLSWPQGAQHPIGGFGVSEVGFTVRRHGNLARPGRCAMPACR